MTAKYQKNSKTKEWTVRIWWADANGKRNSMQQGGFKTKAAAEEWAKDKSENGQNSSYPNAHKLMLGKFLDDWIAHKENKLSPTTINGYKVNIKKIKDSLGNVLVQELRFDMIQDFIDKQTNVIVKRVKHKPEVGSGEPIIEEVKAAPNTVKYTLRTLHSALHLCKAGGYYQQ